MGNHNSYSDTYRTELEQCFRTLNVLTFERMSYVPRWR